MTINNYKQKATGNATSLANGYFTSFPLVCEIRPLRVIIFCLNIILLTLDWLWGRPQALLQRRVFQLFALVWQRHKTDAFTKLGNLLSELHVPHKQCLTGISNAFSAFVFDCCCCFFFLFFFSLVFFFFFFFWPVFGNLLPRFCCTSNKACPLRYNPQALTKCSPLDFQRSSIDMTYRLYSVSVTSYPQYLHTS